MATVESGVAAGVSFGLTDEQRALRELARGRSRRRRSGRKAAEYDEHQTHAADMVAKAHEVGLMNLHVPESLGGLGLAGFDGMLVGEELNWGCSGIGTSLGANGLGAGPVIRSPAPRSSRRHGSAPLLEEPILCSFGLSEPEAGSDVVGLKTTAERRGDEYVLNGSKTFITNAGHAAWTLIFAKTDPAKGHKGISAFVVPMDTPGRPAREAPRQDGPAGDRHVRLRAHATSSSRLRTGSASEGEGFKIAMQTLDFTRPGTAAARSGSRRRRTSTRSSTRSERVTFGVPIAMHQGVSFMIADMATEIEASRLLVWQAAWLHDQGEGARRRSSPPSRSASPPTRR